MVENDWTNFTRLHCVMYETRRRGYSTGSKLLTVRDSPADIDRFQACRQQVGSVPERFLGVSVDSCRWIRLSKVDPFNFDRWTYRRPLRTTTSGLLPNTLSESTSRTSSSQILRKNRVGYTGIHSEALSSAMIHCVGKHHHNPIQLSDA